MTSEDVFVLDIQFLSFLISFLIIFYNNAFQIYHNYFHENERETDSKNDNNYTYEMIDQNHGRALNIGK